MSYSGLIDRWSEQQPQRLAFVQGEIRCTYRELALRIAAMRSFLASRDVKKGDAVMVMMRNGVDFVAVFFAGLQHGCVMVPCDTAIDRDTLMERIGLTGARLLVIEEGAAPPSGIEDAVECAAVGDDASAQARSSAHPDGDALDADDVALIAFTSGSSGAPKGARLTVGGVFTAARNLAGRLGLCPDDRVLVPMPFSHMFGFVSGMAATLVAGATLVSMPVHDAKEALRLVEDGGITVHQGIPTMFFRELEALEQLDPRPNLGSLRVGVAAGSFVSCTLVERVQTELGMSLVSAYGATETLTVAMSDPNDPIEVRQQTVGKPFEGVETRIVDTDGSVLPRGTMGELHVRSSVVMQGYVQHDLGEQALSRDGWFATGDLAAVDRAGYLRILGRKKDLIIRNGNNVAPAALECLILNNPAVASVAVMGYPDEVAGEKIGCIVALKPGETLDEEGIRSSLRGHVPKFALPDAVFFEPAMPHLPNGKLDRQRLKAMLFDRVGIV